MLLDTSKLVSGLLLEFKLVKLIKASIPVKSDILLSLTDIVPVHRITCGGNEDNEVGCNIDGEVRCYGRRENGSKGPVNYNPW